MQSHLCLLAVLGHFLLLAVPAAAQTPALSASGGGLLAAAVREDEKSFDEVVRGYRASQGLFTVYTNLEENRVLIEIAPEQFERLFLCNVTLEAGDGLYFDSGAMLDNFPFIFKRVGKRIQLIHKNVYYRAETGTPIGRAVERAVSSSIVGSAKIESRPHPERKSVLVDLSSFFVQDYAGVANALGRHKIDFAFDRSESYLGPVSAFPLNVEIEAVLHFKNNRPRGTDGRIADGRSMQHRYRYSLSTVSESGGRYRPRPADDRVGHFLTLHQDYTDPTAETPYVRYINRWHLEKADPSAALSPPKQPIVFWLERTVPLEYREAVREGVLLWNRAFEGIGIEGALEVRQQPDDAEWDPADVRYNTVRWIVNPGGAYAVGPARANPFTGQIYDADIRISADLVRYLVREREDYVAPLGGPAVLTPLLTRLPVSQLCQFQAGLASEAAFGWSVLAARLGGLDPTAREAKAYIHDAIRALVAHEVGHTLGLRHNFRASAAHAHAHLHDRSRTQKTGVSASVMDYNPVNLAPRGKPQGEFWNSGLGEYDYWAIAYAYKPFTAAEESAGLARIAERNLPYGTDEDAFGFDARGIDPVTSPFDLGSDPIRFYRERIEMAGELLATAERGYLRKGERYQKMRRLFSQALRAHATAAASVPKFVGGLYHRRHHRGDAGDQLPFEPVSAARQREALAFLGRYIFGARAFAFSPSLLNQLPPERFEDFSNTPFYTARIDYPVHDQVLDIQKRALGRLYHPIALQRLADLPLHYPKGQPRFTLADMFSGVRSVIWEEVTRHQSISSFRRNLQRAHLAQLLALVGPNPQAALWSALGIATASGASAPPEDAASLARADLRALHTQIRGALATGKLDALTRAHLDESLARITALIEPASGRSGD
ncbi:MAG: zinc-dependent metalloprotease [Aphanocapsa lilacina HA4352-LM1]|jgi:hypothetical protein|nr:zinc-dependent metalloprotease [Aphanocapsa lilacina HA4352-LM1]